MTFSESIEHTRTFDSAVEVCISRALAVQLRDDYAARVVAAEIDGITPRSRALREIVRALESATNEKALVVL